MHSPGYYKHHPQPLRQPQTFCCCPFRYDTYHTSSSTRSHMSSYIAMNEKILAILTIWTICYLYLAAPIYLIAYVPAAILPTITKHRYPKVVANQFRYLPLFQYSSDSNDRNDPTSAPQQEYSNEHDCRIVIIGSGWAGLSAADALLQQQKHQLLPNTSTSRNTTSITHSKRQNLHIQLIDAAPQIGGLASGWKSNQNRSVEGGLHGFWREYRNTFSIIERICCASSKRIDLGNSNGPTMMTMDDILTPYTPSVLYSCRSGRVALAPVMIMDGTDDDRPSIEKELPWATEAVQLMTSLASSDTDSKAVLRLLATFLPAPLDIAVGSEFTTNSKLTIIDRISALNLLSIWANFDPSKVSSWDMYDDTSADTLFRGSAKVSDTLYSELVEPLLAVLPMCPGYDCSAAAALSCFHAFALCRKGAFDVRWCRGTITDKIFTPWIQVLQEQARRNENTFHIRHNTKVTAISEAVSTNKKEFVLSLNSNDNETITCDAIVFAVGIGGAQKLRANSPLLKAIASTKRWDELRAISCLCVRLFLSSTSVFVQNLMDQMKDSPVAVCGPNIMLPELCETGFCIYDLQRLQDEFVRKNPTDMTVIEVDYYRVTNTVMNLSNIEIAELTLRAIAKILKVSDPIPSHDDCVIDVSVVRARNAVSHFSVGSASCTPSSVKLRDGIYICGDWIDRKGHASWSTEKAVVTGRQAAAALASDFNIDLPISATQIIPAAPDTPQLSTLRRLNAFLRKLGPTGSPWGT